jgi:NhaC family Na+:H+ antiporter
MESIPDSSLRTATVMQALVPILVLISLLSFSVYLFGEDASYGPNQIALIIGAVVASTIGWRNGQQWQQIENAIINGVTIALKPILILFCVGLLIGSWILSGTVPTMIYYSLLILDPAIFYAASCLICGIIALSIGSSWTVAGTVGIALIGAAAGLGLSVEITAGAIISGAYFGDKMSPLSDTTNLAPAVTGVELFSHIRHMTWTTMPALVIALVLFTIIGLRSEPTADINDLENTLSLINANFSIGWFFLLPLLVLLVLAWKKVPAMPAIMISALLGLVFALLFQPPLSPEGESGQFQAAWTMMFAGYSSGTGDVIFDDLLSGGGAANMMNTIWLMLCAIFFGGAMEQTGMLKSLAQGIMAHAKTTASIIASTVMTCIGANIIAADQYMAIVVPGRMYKVAFQHHNLAPVNLSRVLEDAGTVTSALVPWNTCGAFMAASLGVPTMVYLPFCFFNLLMPLISILYGIINFKIVPLDEMEGETSLPEAT